MNAVVAPHPEVLAPAPRTMHLTTDWTPLRPARATIGADLERVRLEHRVRRIEHMRTILDARAVLDQDTGRASPALDRVLEDFTEELRQVRGRLAALRTARSRA